MGTIRPTIPSRDKIHGTKVTLPLGGSFLLGLHTLLASLKKHFIGWIIFVDFGTVLYRLTADFLCRNQLDIIEPDVGVESTFGCLIAQLPDPSRTRIVGGEGKQSFIKCVHRLV